eukprot:scaffold1803_cov320-Prasinococcus_capsulatus_cf.AAC.4
MGEPKAPLKVFYCDPCSCPPEYCQYQDCFNKCKPWLLANCPFVDEIYPDLRNGTPTCPHQPQALERALKMRGAYRATHGCPGEDSEELQKKVAELKVSGGTKTSGEEEEEVKKLPGGKIKKKVRCTTTIVIVRAGQRGALVQRALHGAAARACGCDAGVPRLQEKAKVVIEKSTRNRRKAITIIRGLDMFGTPPQTSSPRPALAWRGARHDDVVVGRRRCMAGIKLSEASKLFGKKFASGSSIVKDPTGKEQIDVQGDFLFEAAEYIIKMYKDIPKSAIFLIEDNRKLGSAEDNL